MDPNECWFTGSFPLLMACCCDTRNYEMIEYLLAHGANPNQNAKYVRSGGMESRLSPLKTAASVRDLALVKLLLKYGADPNYENLAGHPALYIAIDGNEGSENEIEIVKTLLHVTDKKYYQKAYECSSHPTIRNIIKEVYPEATEPADGFGGVEYKKKIKYNTPPTNPLLRQVWELLGINFDKNFIKDPNRVLWHGLLKDSIIDCQHDEEYVNEFGLDVDVKKSLKELFNEDDGMKDRYPEAYKLIYAE